MTADIRIIPATLDHVDTIARRMREADRVEIAAASGRSPHDALAFSLEKSAHAWTVTIDGRPEIMFGVGDINILAGVGAVWLLGTDAVAVHYREFLRQTGAIRDQLLTRYQVLRNFVHDGNRVSVRWLRWMGASLSEPVEMNGHLFRLFELRSDDV